MPEWLHIAVPPAPALFGQLLIGLINGAFYAMQMCIRDRV